jgi:hypothetical protein
MDEIACRRLIIIDDTRVMIGALVQVHSKY